MIQPDHSSLSVARQCRLLSISRSSYYYVGVGESAENLALMVEIDRRFLETPFYGARQMRWHLRARGHRVNVKRARRLMRLMGLMPIYQRPRTSIPAKGHKTHPYLLRGVTVDRPNQVWCADITYSAPRQGFPISGRDYGLVEPQGSGVAALEHHGRSVLRRCAGGSPGATRCASDIQHRSRQPVHVLGMDATTARRRCPNLDGRAGALPR